MVRDRIDVHVFRINGSVDAPDPKVREGTRLDRTSLHTKCCISIIPKLGMTAFGLKHEMRVWHDTVSQAQAQA